jgi:hypothetical protein
MRLLLLSSSLCVYSVSAPSTPALQPSLLPAASSELQPIMIRVRSSDVDADAAEEDGAQQLRFDGFVDGWDQIILSHHKSGTYSSINLVAALCCKAVESEEPGDVWGTLNDCQAHECKKKGVVYLSNGFESSVLPMLSRYIANYKKASSRVTIGHFVRNPVDMIVSGYLYHRECKEPEWQKLMSTKWGQNVSKWYGGDETIRKMKSVLGAADRDTNYCAMLKSASLKNGIEAETIRTINSYNGVGSMLMNAAVFKNLSGYHSYCEPWLDPKEPGYKKSWKKVAHTFGLDHVHVNLKWDQSHSSSKAPASKEEMRKIAKRSYHHHMSTRSVKLDTSAVDCEMS